MITPYVNVEEADAYFLTKFDTAAWDNDDLTDIDRLKALSEASRYIDVLGYIGCKTVSTQFNQWPRNYIDRDTKEEVTNVTPQLIKDATCEVALHIVIDNPGRANKGVSKVEIGTDTSIQYKGEERIQQVPDYVKETISQYLATPSILRG